MALFRRVLHPVAWFALYAFLCGWILPFYEAHPMGLDDDAACVVTAGWDQPSTKQVGAPQTDQGQPTHCVLCHLMRAMSGAIPSDLAAPAAPHVTPALLGLPHDLTLAAALAAPSSRGPPTTL